ncbi:MAG: site-2 protease family protein, partial [Candidatus Komeilibacteria bacterium]|nr:site-2 protease family protein [Candidatus Komeilibacteria bacterium]
MILTIVAFILILGFLVLVHELGHFLMARKFKVGVEEFGLGFPPKVIGKKIGNTFYSLNAIPLGGFVKIKGEDLSNSEERDSFASRPVWQRTVIVAAGVTMNIIAGWLVLVILFSVGAPMEITSDINRSYVRSSDIVITDVLADSPAARAGLQLGDKIIALNRQHLTTVADWQTYVNNNSGQEIAVTYKREKLEQAVALTPEKLEDIDANRAVMGVGLSEVGLVRYPVQNAVWMGTQATGGYLKRIVFAFGGLFKNLWQGSGV